MPITSNASICSVTRILPISAVMLDPRLPTNSKLMMVGHNSITMEVRATKPTVHDGIQPLSICNAVCMVITLPMASDTMLTISMEPMPMASISNNHFFRNMLHLAGLLKTWRKKMRYSPKMARAFRNIYFNLMFSSSNCLGSMGVGAGSMVSRPALFLGNAMKSRMLSQSLSTAHKRSKPKAIPP